MSTDRPEAGSAAEFDFFANELDKMREKIRALVAGFVADGFTEREAHEMVVVIFKQGVQK